MLVPAPTLMFYQPLSEHPSEQLRETRAARPEGPRDRGAPRILLGGELCARE